MFNFKKNNKNTVVLFKKIEEKYGIKIPDDFKEFYLNYDHINSKTIYFSCKKVEYDIASFINLEKDFDNIISIGVDGGWIPKNYFPFAYDNCGNYYFWNSVDENIYVIYCDDCDNPRQLFKSFKDLFKSLRKTS